MGVGQSQVSIIKEVSLNIYVEKSSNKSSVMSQHSRSQKAPYVVYLTYLIIEGQYWKAVIVSAGGLQLWL